MINWNFFRSIWSARSYKWKLVAGLMLCVGLFLALFTFSVSDKPIPADESGSSCRTVSSKLPSNIRVFDSFARWKLYVEDCYEDEDSLFADIEIVEPEQDEPILTYYWYSTHLGRPEHPRLQIHSNGTVLTGHGWRDEYCVKHLPAAAKSSLALLAEGGILSVSGQDVEMAKNESLPDIEISDPEFMELTVNATVRAMRARDALLEVSYSERYKNIGALQALFEDESVQTVAKTITMLESFSSEIASKCP